jgi:hypothetical protein
MRGSPVIWTSLLVVLAAVSPACATLPAFCYSYSFATPGWSGQGLEYCGTNLYWLDAENGTVCVFDPDDGTRVFSFGLPSISGVLGLAYYDYFFGPSVVTLGGTWWMCYFDLGDGEWLGYSGLVGNYTAATSYYDGSVYAYEDGGWLTNIYYNRVPFGTHLDGLAGYGSSLIGGAGDTCYEIDPFTGNILSTFKVRPFAGGIGGLASDGMRLFVTGAAAPGGLGRVDVYVPCMAVSIDIKPGSDINRINPRSRALIPVAILTTESFDATTVDPATVTLNGASAVILANGKSLVRQQDVDRDRDIDLVVQIDPQTNGAVWTSGTVEFVGQTRDGRAIRGEDDIVVMPGK